MSLESVLSCQDSYWWLELLFRTTWLNFGLWCISVCLQSLGQWSSSFLHLRKLGILRQVVAREHSVCNSLFFLVMPGTLDLEWFMFVLQACLFHTSCMCVPYFPPSLIELRHGITPQLCWIFKSKVFALFNLFPSE